MRRVERPSRPAGRYASTFVGGVAAGTQKGRNLTINVDVDAGMPIKNISSRLFPIIVDRQNPCHSTVSLRRSGELPNKDFVLTYELANADNLKSGYLAYRNPKAKDRDGYATFMLLPPAKVTGATAAPKEMIFLVDCSGSQAGAPLEKAKETLNYIIEHMNQNDTFQILAFNSQVATLSDQPIKATASEKSNAHNFINSLEAVGGTWMGPAVQRVLHEQARENIDLERLRIVTFMTDGCVGNDLEIMEMIKKERGRSRWFSFGTGNSVNRNLIDNVARLGGGEADYVLLDSSAEEVGKKFYSRISSPALTDVKLETQGLGLYDILPGSVSDVWANKPLYFTARYKAPGHGKVVLKGYAQGKPYKQVLDVVLPENNTTNSAIEKIWARQKIDSLTDQDLLGLYRGVVQPQVQFAVTDLALAHKLMSPFTSFVAVDSAPPSQGPSLVVPVQNLQPDGLSPENSAPAVGAASPSIAAATATSLSSAQVSASAPVWAQAQGQAPAQAEATVPLTQAPTAAAAAELVASANQAHDGSNAPGLQGATNGTIGPQGADATIIDGVNTCGTVRVNNLANLEALLNFMANGTEIFCIAWGGASLVIGLRGMADREEPAACEE